MKIFVVVSCFLAFFGLGATVDMTWGNVGPYDTLLHYEIVKKSSAFLQVVTLDVIYPQQYSFNNRTITGIRARDQMPDSKGGYAQLYAGGPGFNHTTIHFKSQRNKGFNFVVEIFGSR